VTEEDYGKTERKCGIEISLTEEKRTKYFEKMIKSGRLRCAEHYSSMVRKNAHKILVVNPEEKILLGRVMSRWGKNITMDLRERECKGVG
jgi:protein-arginine kinase activator protein McsA